MNSFSVMMAASRAANKKEEAIQIKPVVIKREVGRPPAAKQAAPVIDPFPIVDLTNVTLFVSSLTWRLIAKKQLRRNKVALTVLI
jgi:hypothetical protein